jgi:hypothetical protein
MLFVWLAAWLAPVARFSRRWLVADDARPRLSSGPRGRRPRLASRRAWIMIVRRIRLQPSPVRASRASRMRTRPSCVARWIPSARRCNVDLLTVAIGRLDQSSAMVAYPVVSNMGCVVSTHHQRRTACQQCIIITIKTPIETPRQGSTRSSLYTSTARTPDQNAAKRCV